MGNAGMRAVLLWLILITDVFCSYVETNSISAKEPMRESLRSEISFHRKNCRKEKQSLIKNKLE